MCLQFLWILISSSSLLANALATQGSTKSAHSVNSKTVVTVSRIGIAYYLGVKVSEQMLGRTQTLKHFCQTNGQNEFGWLLLIMREKFFKKNNYFILVGSELRTLLW